MNVIKALTDQLNLYHKHEFKGVYAKNHQLFLSAINSNITAEGRTEYNSFMTIDDYIYDNKLLASMLYIKRCRYFNILHNHIIHRKQLVLDDKILDSVVDIIAYCNLSKIEYINQEYTLLKYLENLIESLYLYTQLTNILMFNDDDKDKIGFIYCRLEEILEEYSKNNIELELNDYFCMRWGKKVAYYYPISMYRILLKGDSKRLFNRYKDGFKTVIKHNTVEYYARKRNLNSI